MSSYQASKLVLQIDIVVAIDASGGRLVGVQEQAYLEFFYSSKLATRDKHYRFLGERPVGIHE